jgi:hypothetical protein
MVHTEAGLGLDQGVDKTATIDHTCPAVTHQDQGPWTTGGVVRGRSTNGLTAVHGFGQAGQSVGRATRFESEPLDTSLTSMAAGAAVRVDLLPATAWCGPATPFQ